MMKIILSIWILVFTLIFNLQSYSENLLSLGNNLFIIVVHDTLLMSNLKTEAKVITTLDVTSLVKTLKKSGIMITNNGKISEWVYVDALYYSDNNPKETVKGWILDTQMADSKDFKRVTNFNEYILRGMDGDFVLDYHFYKDGKYKRKEYDENNKSKILSGTAYRFNDVIFAKDDEGKIYELFYLNENDDLCYDFGAGMIKAKMVGQDNLKGSKQEGQTKFYTLTGDNVNVRAEASTNSAVLIKLSKGAKVSLLKRSDIALTVGDKKGFWAYIDTGIKDKKGGTIKGWVFDYYLKKEE